MILDPGGSRPAGTPRKDDMTTRLVKAVLTAVAALAVPAVAGATEVKVENYTDDPVGIALAYNKWKGDVAAEGWFVVKSGENRTFQVEDANDVYMRVTRKGNEVTFNGHTTYLYWPMTQERFSLSKAPDDTNVRHLVWGPELDKKHFMKKGDALPTGWKEERFFKVGTGKHTLEVRP